METINEYLKRYREALLDYGELPNNLREFAWYYRVFTAERITHCVGDLRTHKFLIHFGSPTNHQTVELIPAPMWCFSDLLVTIVSDQGPLRWTHYQFTGNTGWYRRHAEQLTHAIQMWYDTFGKSLGPHTVLMCDSKTVKLGIQDHPLQYRRNWVNHPKISPTERIQKQFAMAQVLSVLAPQAFETLTGPAVAYLNQGADYRKLSLTTGVVEQLLPNRAEYQAARACFTAPKLSKQLPIIETSAIVSQQVSFAQLYREFKLRHEMIHQQVVDAVKPTIQPSKPSSTVEQWLAIANTFNGATDPTKGF